MRSWLVVCALALGCSGPPSSHHEPFEWTVALSGVPDALLATCSDDQQLYAVGGRTDRGFVLRWTGSAWLREPVPASAEELWWCWVDPEGVAWAVGEGATVINRRDGVWRSVDTGDAIAPTATLYGVWGSSASDIHVVGGSLGPTPGPAIAHFDGSEWRGADVSGLPEEILFKVWGSSNQVWAVGSGGTIAHSSGADWSVQPTPIDDRLIALWGTGSDELFAVGGDGRGVVLRYDAGTWREFAAGPEALSGVWTAPGRPLYVGGNRGYLARYGRGADGQLDPAKVDINVPVNDLCVHSMTGYGSVVVAAGADLFAGNNDDWHGGLLAHNGDLRGPVDAVDAGAPDAGVPDAAPPDAAVADATVSDAGALPGPGEPCGSAPDFCAPGLTCWQLFTTGDLICTEDCTSETECQASYGAGACCARPGPQTVNTVCIPAGANECTMQW